MTRLTEKRIAFVRLLQRARAETGKDKPGSALLALVAALDARATEAERMASIHKAESDEIDRLTQRWTAQVEHMKAGIVALANAWESRTRRGSGAGKRVTYRICSRELLAEWDRLALEAAPPERERGAMGPFCGYCQHHHHHAGIRCREGGCECLGMDGGAHRMDAADGPTCRCGRPSRHESGWCGSCGPLAPPEREGERVRALEEALRETRWWGHANNPETWCWCDHNGTRSETGLCVDPRCALARRALSSQGDGGTER